MNNLSCPDCGLSQIKRNGHTHYGKQNYQCKKNVVGNSSKLHNGSVKPNVI